LYDPWYAVSARLGSKKKVRKTPVRSSTTKE
jgi:hypothetical protein